MTSSAPQPPFREAETDLAQLSLNAAAFAASAGGRVLLAEVGAQAWGHGLDVIVPALLEQGFGAFMVARIDEAERVRELAPDATIVTTQHSAAETFERAAALRLTPALRSLAECERALAAGIDSLLLVVDGGEGLPALSGEQAERCAEITGERGATVLSASTFACAGPELLGLSEGLGEDSDSGYRPVLRLWAPVVATKRVAAHEGISYGHIYQTAGPATLALVSLGYADGLSRAGGNSIPVRLEGETRTVAGRLAMDAFVLDLGDVPAPALGTAAVVLGDDRQGEPSVAALARVLGMSSAEICTRLTARPHRYGRE